MSDSSYRSKDPLGEIRARARQLWVESGSPTDRGWESFIEEAERELLAGKSSGEPSGRTRGALPPVTVAPEVEAVRSRSTVPLLTAVASALDRLLNEHEAFCLYRLLRAALVTVPENAPLHSVTEEEIVAVLAELAGEYPGSALSFASQRDAREEFWRGQMAGWRERDEPLTFSDRNTMQRLEHALRARGGVQLSVREAG